MVKRIICNYPLFMIFVEAPLNICISRDTKGHYKKANEGKLANFTGINSPFEIPVNVDRIIDTNELNLAEAVERCLALID